MVKKQRNQEGLKISPGTLQNLRVSGKLKPSKIGGILLYSHSDLERLLSAGIRENKSE